MASRPARKHLRVALGTTAVCLGLFAGALVGGPAPVSAAVPYAGLASADGVRIGVGARGFTIVEQVIDAGAPTAQAAADSLQSVGFAGYPWPGSETFGLLGTAGGATGVPLQDAVPTEVRSSNTGQSRVVKEYGPLRLQAASTDEESTASARAPLVTGPATAGRTEADAAVRHESSGKVVARATTQAEAITIAGVLRIGGATAVAEVTAELDKPRKKASSLQLTDVTIAGQTVAITEKGVSVAGTTTPLPADSPLTAILEEQQITVEYVRAEDNPDGVVSAGVRITVIREVPGLPEPVEVSYLFGQARASATAGVDTDAPAQNPTPDVVEQPPPVAVDNGPVTVGPGPAAPPPGTLPDVLAPEMGTPTAPVAAPVTGSEQFRTVAALRASGGWYLVLVLGGFTMIISASLLRLFGVKALWP